MYGGILKSIFFVIFGASFFILGIFGAGSIIYFSSISIRIMVIVVSFMVLLCGLALFIVRFNRYRKLYVLEKSGSNKNENDKNSKTLYEPLIGERPIPREIRKPKWPLLEKRTEVPMFDIDDDIPYV